jgi:hypothetical protein
MASIALRTTRVPTGTDSEGDVVGCHLTLSCEEIVLDLRSNCPPSMTPNHLSGLEASAEATLAGWIPLQPQEDSIHGKVAHCVRLAGSHLVKGRELTFS